MQYKYTFNPRLIKLLSNVGDMSLKRRAYKVIMGLNVKEGDNIVDLGCGDGFYLYLLSNLPLRLNFTGFDKDETILNNAKKNLVNTKAKLIKGNVQKLPFRNSTIKKIILTEVLEHIPNDKKALSEIYRVMKPGGVLLITVPSFRFPFFWDPVNWILQNLFSTHISGTNFFAGIWARHIRLYKRDQLEKLVTDIGFKIEEVEELTTRCLPFNHYLVNLVARLLYDIKPPSIITNSLSKFKDRKKPWIIRLIFYLINTFDKLNDFLPGKDGLNIYIKARK